MRCPITSHVTTELGTPRQKTRCKVRWAGVSLNTERSEYVIHSRLYQYRKRWINVKYISGGYLSKTERQLLSAKLSCSTCIRQARPHQAIASLIYFFFI